MTDQEATELIRKALNEVVPDRAAEWETVSLDHTIESLNLDSIATMEMVGVLEDLTDSTFPDEALPKVNTLGDLAALAKNAG